MHSEDILTLWKSQMIGNYLVVFIQIKHACEWGFSMTVFGSWEKVVHSNIKAFRKKEDVWCLEPGGKPLC